MDLVRTIKIIFGIELFEPGKPNSKPKFPQLHKNERQFIVDALTKLLKRKPYLFEVQYGQAVLWLETNYGQWQTPNMQGSFNEGAVHCKGEGPYCILHQDTLPDGTTFTVYFKKYNSKEEGIEDALRNVFTLRKRTAKALSSPNATIMRASKAMRHETYYGGHCPEATKEYGSHDANASLKTPDLNDGTKACTKEAVIEHARIIDRAVKEIAGACGDPYTIPLGTYDDAVLWYDETFF